MGDRTRHTVDDRISDDVLRQDHLGLPASLFGRWPAQMHAVSVQPFGELLTDRRTRTLPLTARASPTSASRRSARDTPICPAGVPELPRLTVLPSLVAPRRPDMPSRGQRPTHRQRSVSMLTI
jgi:hypothetical protein